jgi:predicted  nucleic acid-binding Zn-ribbon protein
MAEIIEKITSTVKNVTNFTKEKTKLLVKITKLKIAIKSKEVDLDEYFEKLGRAYYMQASRGANNASKVAALVEEINKISTDISTLKNELASVQDKQICEHCGSIYKKDAPYCPFCCEHKVVATPKSK